MASFVMSASAVKAPAAKVSGLGFRKAVCAVAMPVQSKPVQARAAFSVVCGKPGAKAKTNKSAAKRFKITASGKVLHRRPGKQHLNGHKSTERKTRLGKERQLGREQLPLVKGLLPYSRKKIR